MIQLIVSDLDGTLLPRGEERLDTSVFEMISKAAEKGVAFAVASGRAYHELKWFFRGADSGMYFIASDGALTVHRENTLFETEIPRRFWPGVLHAAKQNGIPATVFIGKYLSYYMDADETFSRRFQRERHRHVLKIDSFSEIKEPIVKISFYGALSIQLPPDLAQCFSPVYEGDDWIDFAVKDVNKSDAVGALQRKLGIAADEILAFGDNDNDAEMLRMVPHSYAMSGGSARAVAAAANRTDSVADTVRRILHF